MPTLLNDNTKQVLFHPDGEALDFTDMINMQKFQRSHEANLLFSAAQSHGVGIASDPGTIETPEAFQALNEVTEYGGFVYTPYPGAAWVQPGGSRVLTLMSGPIVMLIDEPWGGTGEEWATFRISGNPTLTTAIGDATNPRIDLVEVKLEYIDSATLETRNFEDATTREPSTQDVAKERQIQLTYQIKQGTPAANPAYPTPSAGFVAMGAVYVPALHNGTHNPDNFRDLRMPIGSIRAIDVDPKDFHYTGANPWTSSGGLFVASAGGSSDADDPVIVACPISTKSARLIALGIHGYAAAGGMEIKIGKLTYAAGGADPTFTALCESNEIVTDGLGVADSVQLSDDIASYSVVKGDRAAGSHVGSALWCNGTTGGMAHPGTPLSSGAEAGATRLAVSIAANDPGDKLAFVRFWIAEGL